MRRVSLVALLALATGAQAAGLPADLRLSATVSVGGRAEAWLEAGDRGWRLAAGETFADCRLATVRHDAVRFDCPDGERVLRLSGTAGARTAPRGTSAGGEDVTLPPGLLAGLAARPQALALAADFAPAQSADGRAGWRVTRLAPGGPLAGAGLAEGDLVLAVAGVPAAEPAAFMAVLRALPELPAFECELLRDGRPLRLQVVAPPAS